MGWAEGRGGGGGNQPHSYLYSLFLHHSSAVSLHRDLSNLTISLYLTSVQWCHLSGSAMKNINHRAHTQRRRQNLCIYSSWYQVSCLSSQWSEITKSQARAFLGKPGNTQPCTKKKDFSNIQKIERQTPPPPLQSNHSLSHPTGLETAH